MRSDATYARKPTLAPIDQRKRENERDHIACQANYQGGLPAFVTVELVRIVIDFFKPST